MRRILVAIDFSSDSFNALEHGLLMANSMKTHLRIVHVKKSDEFVIPYNPENGESNKTLPLEEYLATVLNKYQDSYEVEGGIFDFKIRKGNVYVEITNQAHYDDSFMIIVGTHGASGFKEYLLGSNAFRVVDKAMCPVLTVRHGFMPEPIRKIVVPLDVTNQTRIKVPFAIDIAMAYGAEIHALGVYETSTKEVVARISQYVDQVCEHITNRGVTVVKETISGTNITDMTIEYAKNIHADMIIIMTEQTERPENIFLGPYPQQMVNHSPIPVLSIHPADK